ncbi:MAG: alpha/beta fold hydrolase [Cyanobacteria bacterium P01_H01_bin.105]
MMILDSDPVTQAVFYPRPEPPNYVSKGIATLTSSEGVEIAGYLHESKASHVLLILFHGNGELAADYDAIVSMYLDCGISCWVVDYRGYGRSTGTPTFSTMLRDAEAILADVPRIGAAINRNFSQIIVLGRSLGSASAIHLAAMGSSSVKGLVLDSAYADGLALIARLDGPNIQKENIFIFESFENKWNEEQSLPNLIRHKIKRNQFEDNIDKIKRCQLPTLIIHGTDDSIIPLADAVFLFKACPSKDKQLVKVRGADHNNLFYVGFADYSAALKNYLVRCTTV